MRLAFFIALMISARAQAQFGVGLNPGTSCPGPFAPSNQAFNGQDELSNLSGQLAARNTRIDQLKLKEQHLNEDIENAKTDMGRVITSKGFTAIREHRERHNSYGSYRNTCGGGGRPNSNAGGQTDPELFSTGGSQRTVDTTQTQYPPPDAYCVTNPATGLRENLWEKFVEDDGTVSDRLCDFRIAGVTKDASREQRDRCHKGMHDYYSRMAEKEKLRTEISKLDNEALTLERSLKRVRDEITEGTYCATCYAQRRGYANQGTGNSLMQNTNLLNMFGNSMGNQPTLPQVYRPPYGPQVMPNFGYPGRPYNAPVPGYYGVQQGPRPGMGNYGTVPGGIGQGAFGCQNNNPFGSPNVQPIFGNQSPFNSPYTNPTMMSMFNQGGGPWGLPQYGNGMTGFQNPFAPNGFDAFGNPINQNPFGGPFGQQNQFNPYGQNPYGPNPYMQNQYGQNPFGGPNPYAPNVYGQNPWGMNPYNTYNPYPTMPNYGYQNSWNSPLGSPVGNYFGQINQLNSRIQWIQNGGSYYGGNTAPVTAPYMPQPIYNTPGGLLNPSPPRSTPPAVLPYTR